MATDEDGVTRCPPGIADHAHDLATRGTGLWVTCWPNPRNQLPNLPWHHVRGSPLWQQELAVYTVEMSPRLAALLHWQHLWRALEEIPEDEAIEDDPPRRASVAVERAAARKALWARPRKLREYKSAFCASEECRFCKQVDCDCTCHQQAA
jgi:hypothetical protein